MRSLVLCNVVGFALASITVLGLSSQTASADDKKPLPPDVTTLAKPGSAPVPVPVPYPIDPVPTGPKGIVYGNGGVTIQAVHPGATTNNSTPQGAAPAAKSSGGGHK